MELQSKPELKKYMKRVMPFVQATREKVDTIGLKALNLTLDFDETEVLLSNLHYLTSTLDVSILLPIKRRSQGITSVSIELKLNMFHSSTQLDEIAVKQSDCNEAPENVREECCPGVPYMTFGTKPGVTLDFINPTPLNGLFTHKVPVHDLDSAEKVALRLAKMDKGIKSKLSFIFLSVLIV